MPFFMQILKQKLRPASMHLTISSVCMHFRESLFIQAYKHANADDKPKQNTVYAYINCILDIIETFYVEQVDGKDWFLINHAVDDAAQIVKEIIKTSFSEIERFIQNHGSFAEAVDSVKHDSDTKNEYHYLNKSIHFQGRSDDLKYLDSLLSAKDSFLFAVITGGGGAGKSKLLNHFRLRETSNLEWKIVFPPHRYIEQFLKQHKEWKHPKNLLIIIDYAGEIPKIVGEWINLLQHSEKRPGKMRIVILERQGITVDKNGVKLVPHWYQQMAKSGGHNFETLLYQGRFYPLEPMEPAELFLLIDNLADNKGRGISLEEKEAIFKRAVEMGAPDNIYRFTTPLMIILLTDAFFDGEIQKILNPSNLMMYVIDKHQKYWKDTICSGSDPLFTSLEKLVVYATATGNWDLKPLPEPLARDSATLLDSRNRTDLRSMLSGVSENSNPEMYLPPLEPDPVGEYFVLWFLSESTSKSYYEGLIKLLWAKPLNFAYFLERCISSYLCDSNFVHLIIGEYSLFGAAGDPYLSSMLLVNLTAFLPLNVAERIVDMLETLAEDKRYAGNQEIVLAYAKGLFNLSCDQDTVDYAATIERLKALAEDERYAGNHEIVLVYAMGLFNLSNKQQDPKDCSATIKDLKALAEDGRYAGNHEIVLVYAKGLFNRSNKQQDPKDCANTIKDLKALA